MPLAPKRRTSADIELQMTPMIDVTFLLLIFFMCSVKFKLLDGKLDTWLPRGAGVNASPMRDLVERIKIRIERAGSAPAGFAVRLNGRPMSGLDQLGRKLAAYRIEDPEASVTLCTGEGIEYGHVVATVNECLRAGMTSITFRGVPLEE